MAKMIINYWGDVMCPFCYLGEIALERALERFPHRDQVEIRWKSSLLHSDLAPGESISFRAHLEISGNDEAQIDKKNAVLRHLCEQMGIEYGLDRSVVINSAEIARLLKRASDRGILLAVAQRFGKAYLTEGVDLSIKSEVERIAAEGGMSATDIEEVLSSDVYLADIKQDQVAALHACPRFIPTVHFNHGIMLDGILKEEELLDALHQSYKRWKAFTFQLQTMDDNSMGPDECGAICDMPAPGC